MLSEITFTVFTPSYNRAHTLHRVFESLKQQSYQNFEWLVVDDGSNDNTKNLLDHWQKEVAFPIRYFYQTNQGKHIAFNKGVLEAKGEFFLPLDSDDACVAEALERLLSLWQEIPNKDNYSGVCVLCKDQNGDIVGDTFPKAIFDSNSCEIFYKYGIKGEKWGFHRTAVLKQYPFPTIKEVKFIPESIIWHNVAKHYKIRFVNEALRIYFQEADLNQSITSSKALPSHQRARLEYYHWALNNDIAWFYNAPLTFTKYAFQWVRFSLLLNRFNLRGIRSVLAKLLIALLFLPACCLALFEINYAK